MAIFDLLIYNVVRKDVREIELLAGYSTLAGHTSARGRYEFDKKVCHFRILQFLEKLEKRLLEKPILNTVLYNIFIGVL